MENLSTLQQLADAISDPTIKENALTLVERMGEVIEGIGDRPIEYRPETLKLVQATSDRGKLPKGASIGSIVLGEDIMEAPFEVIPLRSYITRQMWDPNPDNAQMVCNSPDGKVGWRYGECYACPYSKFDTENNRSQCNKTLTVLCVAADLSKLFFVNFSKSNYAFGNEWLGLMKKAGVSPYKRRYELNSASSPKSKNVEILKAEPAKVSRVDGEVLTFVEELFKVSSDDRKKAIDGYYQMIENRKKRDEAALEDKSGDADMILLAAEGGEPEAIREVEAVTVGDDEDASAVESKSSKGGKKNYGL